MFEFEAFVASILRRARAERFVRSLGLFGLCLGGSGLILALIAQFLPLPPRVITYVQIGILAAVPLTTALVAWIGSRRLPDASKILFELDRRLHTEARISSLHVLTRSGATGFFTDRLTETVTRESEGWEGVYRPTWRTLASLAGVIVLLVGIVALALVESEPDEEPLPSTEIVTEIEGLEEPLPEELDTIETERIEDSSTDWIAQALADLEQARSDSGADEVPSGFDPEEVELYTTALLEELRERGARPLSAEELERLSELATTAPLELGDALDAVLAEDDPKEIEDQLELIADYARQQADLDRLLEADDRENPESSAERFVPESPAAGEGEDEVYPMSGYGDERETEPSLREAPLPGEPGVTGDVHEYITGGVPIDLYSSGGGPQEIQPQVDYERVETILDTRALPQDAFETVRRYFELVGSEGET